MLLQHHVESARVFADRRGYLDTLPKGSVCAEVGVLKGDLSAYILEHMKPAALHLIDRNLTKHAVRERFAGQREVSYHEGDSACMLRTFPSNYFDWIYIDAGHTYQVVSADVEAAVPRVKQNGRLIFNDYILWAHNARRFYGIIPVVNRLCVEGGWRMEAFSLSPTMYCDVALVRA